MAKTFDDDGNVVEIDEKTEKARKAAFEQISKKAILVDLRRRQLSNMPFDIKLSEDVSTQLGLPQNDHLMVRKFLVNPQHLAKIRSLINDAAMLVYNHTRPWDNIGFRLLPMEYYDDFVETFGQIKDEFEEAVNEFIDNWDDYVKEAKKNLGKAFNKKDYPDKAQVRDLFLLEIQTAEFPEIDDIRLNISGPELVAMKEEVALKYADANAKAVKTLCGIAEKVNANVIPDLLGAVASLVSVNDDTELEMMLKEVETKLGSKATVKTDSKKSMMVMDDIEGLDMLDDADDVDDTSLDSDNSVDSNPQTDIDDYDNLL